MANILYLVHRMPYPPDKGDKVRSYHLLQHLAARHRVFVGTFVDDPADATHVPALQQLCAGVHAARLHPRRARLASLSGLLTGQALTLAYYADVGLRRWVLETAAREHFDAVVVFSSSMAPYAQALAPRVPLLVDLVDVDSAKWAAYADHHRWPLSWLYRREGRKLLAYERSVVAAAQRSFLATDKEVELLLSLAPECAGRVQAMGNGVNAEFFSPQADRRSPFEAGEVPLVFTGAMDYWPNVDAVCWFAGHVLPALRELYPGLRLHIVGRSPTAAVQALQGEGVKVTGTVPDVRPYLQHAAVVVAPLRLARGIQNKVLEAMAMARPVVAASACVAATSARPGHEIVAADDDAASYVKAIDGLLRQPDRAAALGTAGRQRVLASYTWPAHMAVLEQQLQASVEGAAAAAAPVDRTPAPARLSEGIT
jgi:sugar transferase (PEP-CTERM/EpsH1 system associated)